MTKILTLICIALMCLIGAAAAQEAETKETGQKEEGASFESLDLTDPAEDQDESAADEQPKPAEEAPPAEESAEEAPLLDLSAPDEEGEPTKEAAPEEKPPLPKPEELSNILVVFRLKSDEATADLIDLVNAEVHMVLDGSGKFQLMSSDDLAGEMETHPDTALGYCNEDPECIANIVAAKNARWVVFGDIKRSFDGSLVLARLVKVDMSTRQVEVEKFGQFKLEDENIVADCGNLVRELIGIPVVKPKPKPEPKVATVERPPELAPKKVVKEAPPPVSPWSNPWTWTLAGIGVASLTGGIVLGVMSNNKVDDASHPGFDQPSAYTIVQDAEDLALGANIAFAVGGAALAGAVVLFIIDATSKPPQVAPAVACSGLGCSAVIFGSF